MIRSFTLTVALILISGRAEVIAQTTTPRTISQEEEEGTTGLVAAEASPALQPAARNTGPAARWWPGRHAARIAQRDEIRTGERRADLVFLGDSITQGWEGAGKALWAERFAPRGAWNLGFSGDRTEHVLWRLGLGDAGEANNELAGVTPKLIVLMIGTNNTGHRQDPAEETAAGIEAIVDRLHAITPDSQVLLLGIFPRGAQPTDPMRLLNAAINERIAPLGEREYVDYLDLGGIFLNEDGVITKPIMPDGLHPQATGYRLWADAIEPHLVRLLGEAG